MLKIVLISLGIVVGAALVLPFLVPLERYIPALEKAASDRLREPVKVAWLRASLLPPGASAGGISVGENRLIQVGEVRLVPNLWSLLSGEIEIARIDIDDLELAQPVFGRLGEWARSDGPGPKVRLGAVRIEKLTLAGVPVGPLQVEIRFTPAGGIETAQAQTRDGALSVQAKPDADRYALEANAKAWTVPFGQGLAVDTLAIAASAGAHELDITAVSASLYGGTLQGKGKLDWRKELAVNASVTADRLDMARLLSALGMQTRMSGRLSARSSISARGKDAERLLSGWRVEAPFSVSEGVLHGVDLFEAAKALVKGGQTGGQTRFDELSGVLSADPRGYRVNRLKVASGVLHANGNVNVTPARQLSGRVNAEVKLGVSVVAVPLNVSGTVQQPMLMPTGAAVAGAAAGTALMGPLGTAAGMQAGSAIDRMFGGGESKRR